jgi:hypothetical protein
MLDSATCPYVPNQELVVVQKKEIYYTAEGHAVGKQS